MEFFTDDVSYDLEFMNDILADGWEQIEVIDEEVPLHESKSEHQISENRKRPNTQSSNQSARCTKVQRTQGEPCLLHVCQFPIRVSNAINAGDQSSINATIDTFITHDCLGSLIQGSQEAVQWNGASEMKKLFAAMLETMPDLSASVTGIKLRAGNCIVFRMSTEGTFIGCPSDEYQKFATPFTKNMLSKFDKYVKLISGDKDSQEEIASTLLLKQEVEAETRRCFIKCDVTGRLIFCPLGRNEEPKSACFSQNTPVSKFIFAIDIKSMTPRNIE
jgi:hypothetical protein